MNVRNATAEQIRLAAAEVGVRLENFRPATKGYAFTLKVGREKRYRRASTWDRRKDGAPRAIRNGCVCWHGHRDFCRALYRLAPRAEVRTALARYNGAAHFEATYRSTGGARGRGGKAVATPDANTPKAVTTPTDATATTGWGPLPLPYRAACYCCKK